MNLYFLRHGIAIPRGTKGFEKDPKRPLTDEGRAEMKLIAKAMQKLELKFRIILSSPYVRTRQTAEIVHKRFSKRKLRFSKNLVCEANSKSLVKELRRALSKDSAVLLIGHEPFLSQLISVLVMGHPHSSIILRKGGLCKLSIDSLQYARCAALEWLLTPKQLLLIAEA